MRYFMHKLVCFLCAFSLVTYALNPHAITIKAHKQSAPCLLMFVKMANNISYRYCVFTKILGGSPALMPSRDRIIALAKDLVVDWSPLQAQGEFFEMPEPGRTPLAFKITVKLDILVALQTF